VLPHAYPPPTSANKAAAEAPAFAGSFRDLTSKNRLLATMGPPSPLAHVTPDGDFMPVILKRPPLYKRFLSNTVQTIMDEERASNGRLNKRDSLSVH
jgi:hypothetical protein